MGPNASEMSSLAAIKGLAQISDSTAQLQQASKLCDHAARAEMIMRWIFDKPVKQKRVQQEPGFWSLLSQASRLVAPDRLAPLISQVNIFEVAEDVLRETTPLSSGWLDAAAQYFDLLFAVAVATDSGPLRSVLSIDSQRAASFLNVWICAMLPRLEEGVQLGSVRQMLAPAFHVWAHRKYHPDENAHFADTCLNSAAQLHSDLSLLKLPPGSSGKRLSGGTVSSNAQSPQDAVESMLARHVFLPARVAFFREFDHVGANNGVSRGSITSIITLRVLERLQSPSDQQDISDLERYGRILSGLLDVAYRCTPLTTPRQRVREKPWIEAVFIALSSCCCRLQKQELVAPALCRLLSNVRRPCLLSKGILVEMHNAHAKAADEGNVEWELIARIAALQPTIYTDTDRAGQLFDSISLVSESNVSNTITEQILKPIIEAFSETRELNTYIDLWHRQLSKQAIPDTCFSSIKAREIFSAQIHSALLPGQIKAVVHRVDESFGQAVNSFADSKSADRLQPRLFADMVLLRGVLGGLIDDVLLDAVVQRLRNTFYSLSSLVKVLGNNASETYKSTLWGLLADLLRTWFPRWACVQDRDTTLAEIASLRSSPAVREATALVNKGQSNSEYTPTEKHALELVLVSIMLSAPGGEMNQEGDHMTALAKPHPGIIARMLICRPQLINIRTTLYPQALEHCVTQLRGSMVTNAKDESKTQDMCPHRLLLDGLVSAGVSSHNNTVTEVLVSTVESFLSTYARDEEGVAQVLLGLLILAELNPTYLVEEQRLRITSCLTSLTCPNLGEEEHCREVEQRRVSAVMQWMPYSHFGPQFSAQERDALFWNVAGVSQRRENSSTRTAQDSIEQLRSLDLLDVALRSVFRHVLVSKYRFVPRDALSQTTKSLDQYMSRFCAQAPADFDSHLAIATRVAISEEGRTPGDSGADLSRNPLSPGKLQKYGDKLLSILEWHLEQGARNMVVLCVVLDSLADLSRIEKDRELSAKFHERMNGLVSSFFSEAQKTAQAIEGGNVVLQSMFSRCFAVACAWRLAPEPKPIPEIAAALLTNRLTPQNSSLVLGSFRQATESMLDASSKIALIDHILSINEATSAQALKLAREVIATIQKSDTEGMEERRLRQVVKKLLGLMAKTETSDQACASIIAILREKSFLVDQYILEAILAALTMSVKLDGDQKRQFKDCCLILRLILRQYRSRVQDRMHLLSNLVQSLFTCFGSGQLSAPYAAMLSRVLQQLCDPPMSRSNHKARGLVDEARKTRAKVGKYMQFALHGYCVVVLKGRLSGDVREALKPGLWAMIAAMETDNAEAIKTLSSSMNNSERAILRTTYQDYEAVGKWTGK